MNKFFYIGLGGALGSLLRYGIAGWAQRLVNSGFPWGTLTVNLIGSLVIGLAWGICEAVVVSQGLRIFFFIGVLGSFTTFSTFSLENFHLIRDGEYGLCAANMGLSLGLGMTLVFAGYFLSRYILNIIR